MSDAAEAPCIMVSSEGANTCVCTTTDPICGVCHGEMAQVPALLLYRPSRKIYELICRECGMIILKAAKVRLNEPEYDG